MGFAKHQWEKAQDRGWNTPDSFVCEDCVDDDHLKELVRAHPEATTCSCCEKKRRKPFAAPLEVLMPSIAGAVYQRFSDPNSAGVPWDDGPVDEGIYTLDMLDSLPLDGHYKFIEAVSESFHNTMWVTAHNGFWLAPVAMRCWQIPGTDLFTSFSTGHGFSFTWTKPCMMTM
jgi:hypothetical protein